MSNDFQEAIGELASLYKQFEAEDRALLLRALRAFISLASNPDTSQLKNVLDYMSRKTKILRASQHAGGSMRQLRNSLVHQGRVEFLQPELNRYSSTLWRLLERSADEWDQIRLYNILSYCIGPISAPAFDPDKADALGIVRTYKKIYNRLDPDSQERCFRELVIRLYSDPVSRRILERSEIEE